MYKLSLSAAVLFLSLMHTLNPVPANAQQEEESDDTQDDIQDDSGQDAGEPSSNEPEPEPEPEPESSDSDDVVLPGEAPTDTKTATESPVVTEPVTEEEGASSEPVMELEDVIGESFDEPTDEDLGLGGVGDTEPVVEEFDDSIPASASVGDGWSERSVVFNAWAGPAAGPNSIGALPAGLQLRLHSSWGAFALISFHTLLGGAPTRSGFGLHFQSYLFGGRIPLPHGGLRIAGGFRLGLRADSPDVHAWHGPEFRMDAEAWPSPDFAIRWGLGVAGLIAVPPPGGANLANGVALTPHVGALLRITPQFAGTFDFHQGLLSPNPDPVAAAWLFGFEITGGSEFDAPPVIVRSEAGNKKLEEIRAEESEGPLEWKDRFKRDRPTRFTATVAGGSSTYIDVGTYAALYGSLDLAAGPRFRFRFDLQGWGNNLGMLDLRLMVGDERVRGMRHFRYHFGPELRMLSDQPYAIGLRNEFLWTKWGGRVFAFSFGFDVGGWWGYQFGGGSAFLRTRFEFEIAPLPFLGFFISLRELGVESWWNFQYVQLAGSVVGGLRFRVGRVGGSTLEVLD